VNLSAICDSNINHEQNLVQAPFLPLRGARDWWKFSSGGGRNLRLLMSLRDPLAAYSRRLAINQDWSGKPDRR
jgi:hypothetical protein